MTWYVLGEEEATTGYYFIKIWKNGVSTNLTAGNSNARAYSMAVLGNDVYVVGHIGKVATIWKNGVATSLSDGTDWAQAYSVIIVVQ